MIAAVIELSGNWRLIAAVLTGFVLGFILVKTGLSDVKRLRSFLSWHDADLWQILTLTTFLAALLFYFLRSRNVLPETAAGSTYFALLAGGILCGSGVVVSGMSPLTALASLASGKLQSLWFFCGGMAAIWIMSQFGDPLRGWLSSFGGGVKKTRIPREFWNLENPLIWVAGVALAAAIVSIILAHREGGRK